MSTESDVFQHAAEAQKAANEAYAALKARLAEVEALRGEVSAFDRFGEIAAHAMPLLKRFIPIIAAAGGVGAVASDPSLLGGILSQVAAVFSGG